MNKQVGNVQLMQKMNRLKVLNFIRQNPSVARPMVAEATGLSLSSITNIITYLIEKNIVTETGLEDVGRVGRKGVLLQFNSQAYDLICVNLEASFISIAYTDLSGNIKEKKVIKIKNQDSKLIMDILKKEILNIINNYDNKRVLGIGIAISGLVLENSRFILSSSLKWKSINVKDELEQYTGMPVFVENVSITKAVWQFNNEEQMNSENMLFVDLEDGIGAVQFYNGAINRSIIGEIGHTTVEKEGIGCFCGNKGCLEAMCSIDRIVSQYKVHSNVSDVKYDIILKKYNQGDRIAENILKECGEYLGIGLANLVNIFNPATLIINGGEYLKCDYIFDVAIECMRNRAYPILTQNMAMKKVNIGIDESIKGIAINLCDRIFDISFPYNIIE